MKSIHAIWKNGQIVPTQPVDWPDGTALAVEPIAEPLETDSPGDLLGDDPQSIARWLAWLASLEPLSFSPEEAGLRCNPHGNSGETGRRPDSTNEQSDLKGCLNETIFARHRRCGRSDQSSQGR